MRRVTRATNAGPNVLVTSAARKVALVRAFQAALAERGDGGVVIAVDVEPRSATLYLADEGWLVPRSDDPSFVPALLDLCRRRAIGLVVPTRDEELPVLAAARASFEAEGTGILVGSEATIALCQDKLVFVQRCEQRGIPVPRRIETPHARDFPLFARPRRGKGGIGAREIRTHGELAGAAASAGDHGLILQEVVRAPEYTIDLFADFEGRVLSVAVRERLAISPGESVVGVTRHVPVLRDVALDLAETMGLSAHNTIQAFLRDGEPLIIEVNPRIGGASALSFAAGASTPRTALRLIAGDAVEPDIDGWQEGLVMLRFGTDLFLPEPNLMTRRWPP
jgi:carbamoyl-phosphate synthase large subunit